MKNLTIGQKVGYSPIQDETYTVVGIRKGNRHGRNVKLSGAFRAAINIPKLIGCAVTTYLH